MVKLSGTPANSVNILNLKMKYKIVWGPTEDELEKHINEYLADKNDRYIVNGSVSVVYNPMARRPDFYQTLLVIPIEK